MKNFLAGIDHIKKKTPEKLRNHQIEHWLVQFTSDMSNMLFQVFLVKEKPQDHQQTDFSLIPVSP